MSELIGGKEALIALANGNYVQARYKDQAHENCWFEILKTDQLATFDRDDIQFRIKTRTITINGIEVPAPFEPKEGEWFYFIKADSENGYSSRKLHDDTPKYLTLLGAWRTEEEIKQVVAALRSIFK